MKALKFLGRIVAVLLAIVALALLWGVGVEPRFLLDQNTETARVPGLPRAWEGREIAAFGDIQVGMWLANEGMVAQAVDAVLARRPAAVLLLGDYVYSPTDDDTAEAQEQVREGEIQQRARDQMQEALRLLEPLTRSSVPVYAVLGNHDYALGPESSLPVPAVAQHVAQALQYAGVRVLRNEAVALPAPAGAEGDPAFYLGGVGPLLPEAANVDAVLEAIPDAAPRLVFMHNPGVFDSFPAGAAPLAIAGHTHGGQLRIPGLPGWSWLAFVQRDTIHADGWIDGYGARGNRLYVNVGIGFTKYPIRINCPPEVTYFRLASGSPPG